MGGCLAGFDKSKSTEAAVDVMSASKDVPVVEPSVTTASKDFWTNSTLGMESNAGFGSQGSVSSISTSNLTIDSNEPPEFANYGLVLWNQTRQQWVGSKRPERHKKSVQEPIINEDTTYESLLGGNKRFPRPIPLAEMVQFLIEVWEEEGLYG